MFGTGEMWNRHGMCPEATGRGLMLLSHAGYYMNVQLVFAM